MAKNKDPRYNLSKSDKEALRQIAEYTGATHKAILTIIQLVRPNTLGFGELSSTFQSMLFQIGDRKAGKYWWQDIHNALMEQLPPV